MTTTEKISIIKEWLGSGSINLFGFPFSGKDSQAALLSAQLGGIVVGGGDILRSKESPVHVRAIMNDGNLAPTDDYLRLVLPYFSQHEFDGRPLILSSVGRWHGEEEPIIQALDQSGHPQKAVILLSLDEEIVHQRQQLKENAQIRGARQDDDITKLARRIEEFNTKTLPVIKYYRKAGLLIEVDGRPSKEAVNQEIIDQLYALATA